MLKSYYGLALLIIVVFGIGTAIGIGFAPAAWYKSLTKPWFNPPDWLFGPAWTVLYICIAIAGWRSFSADVFGAQSLAWIAQMIFNYTWTPVVFGLQWLWPGVGVALLMLASIAVFIALAWNNGDRTSAYLFMPYFAWVGFATLLNVTLAHLNPGA
jgi:translocator protein